MVTRPMDRLICGDVGFGKTEVAMRAAFKMAAEGRQVAILVPTTVLCEQHERSFQARMAEFPVTVASISRFKTKAEQQRTLERLKSGALDIIIGTHRLVSQDVHFKNLGLLIIDEEQRFRRRHQRTTQTTASRRRRAHAFGHADSANAPHVVARHSRHLKLNHPAGRPCPGRNPCRAVRCRL